MYVPRFVFGLVAIAGLGLAGCESHPPASPTAKKALNSDARAALTKMEDRDPDLRDTIRNAHGYAIFPSVGKGGFVVGAAFGKGEVYEGDRFIGYAEIQQGTVGAQVGGQEYAELIVFQNADALNRFTSGNLKFSANASAVALKAGAAKAARFQDGVMVFTLPTGGLMAEASLGGQKFNFHPANSDVPGEPTTAPMR